MRQVFRFNKRMSQSKMSISPLLEKGDDFTLAFSGNDFKADKSYLLEDLKWIDDIDNKNRLPKKPLNRPEPMKTLGVKIKNSGDLPSTNIKVDLVFKAYGTSEIYPKDGEEFKTLIPRELFTERTVNIRIPYMGADEERTYEICALHGQFREAELHLLKIRANGFDYIKPSFLKRSFSKEEGRILLHHYFCSILLSKPKTELDHKLLYGLAEDHEDEI